MVARANEWKNFAESVTQDNKWKLLLFLFKCWSNCIFSPTVIPSKHLNHRPQPLPSKTDFPNKDLFWWRKSERVNCPLYRKRKVSKKSQEVSHWVLWCSLHYSRQGEEQVGRKTWMGGKWAELECHWEMFAIERVTLLVEFQTAVGEIENVGIIL